MTLPEVANSGDSQKVNDKLHEIVRKEGIDVLIQELYKLDDKSREFVAKHIIIAKDEEGRSIMRFNNFLPS